MNWGAQLGYRWVTVYEVAKSQTQLSDYFSLSYIGEGDGNPL